MNFNMGRFLSLTRVAWVAPEVRKEHNANLVPQPYGPPMHKPQSMRGGPDPRHTNRVPFRARRVRLRHDPLDFAVTGYHDRQILARSPEVHRLL